MRSLTLITIFLLPLFFGCQEPEHGILDQDPGSDKNEKRDILAMPLLASQNICKLRWPSEFEAQALEFCNTHTESDPGQELDKVLYPTVRIVENTEDLIRALKEEVPNRRIVLQNSIVLSTEVKFVGPALIEGPGTLIFEGKGHLTWATSNLETGDASCNLNTPKGKRRHFSMKNKLRVTADTKNLRIQPNVLSSYHLVLEGKSNVGEIQLGKLGVLVLVNSDIALARNVDLDHLVAINSVVKSNFSERAGSKLFNSLALSSQFVDVKGGLLVRGRFSWSCWDKDTHTSFSDKQSWSNEYSCKLSQQLIDLWSRCGGG